jgi:acyl-CoA synthetase (AMP-forming)/AMP-acid ligase II
MPDIANPEVEPTFSTLVELFRWRGRNQSHERALVFLEDGEGETQVLTYGDLDRRARAVAAYLQAHGATGNRVLLLHPSGAEFITSFLGCLYARAVAVPAYPPRQNRNMQRLQGMVKNAEPVLALTDSHVLERMHTPWQACAEAPLPWVAADLLGDELAGQWLEPSVQADTLAFLQYTSGSTTEPKGVMVSHGNILANLRMVAAVSASVPHAPIVTWLPLFHDMGLLGAVLQSFYMGTFCVLMPPEAFFLKPVRWLRAISRYGARITGAPNFAYDLCVRKVDASQKAELDLRHLEMAFNAAEPVRPLTLQKFVEAFASCGARPGQLYPCYGLAECTLFVTGGSAGRIPVTTSHPELGGERQLAGCGKTWLDGKILIVDPQTRQPCEERVTGEIWVSGSNVTQGYWNNPEATEETFKAMTADTREGPFLRTGDLGFVQGDELFLVGRLKDVIIIGAQNHHACDLELTTEQCHALIRPNCSAAFAVDTGLGERLVVATELEKPKDGSHADFPGIAQAIRRDVAEQHGVAVSTVLLLRPGAIPKTTSGKVQRHACRTAYLTRTLQPLAES